MKKNKWVILAIVSVWIGLSGWRYYELNKNNEDISLKRVSIESLNGVIDNDNGITFKILEPKAPIKVERPQTGIGAEYLYVLPIEVTNNNNEDIQLTDNIVMDEGQFYSQIGLYICLLAYDMDDLSTEYQYDGSIKAKETKTIFLHAYFAAQTSFYTQYDYEKEKDSAQIVYFHKKNNQQEIIEIPLR